MASWTCVEKLLYFENLITIVVILFFFTLWFMEIYFKPYIYERVDDYELGGITVKKFLMEPKTY